MKRLLFLFCIIALCGTTATSGKERPGAEASDMALYNYFYMESEIQYNLGNYDAAFALMQEAHRIDPSAISAHYRLSQYYLQLNDNERALQLMQVAAEGDTTQFWYNLNYAYALLRNNYDNEAQQVLERMSRNFPDKSNVYNLLSNIYIKKNLFDKAHACYDSIETYVGNSPELVSKRIELYDHTGDTATAISIAEDLVAKNPLNIYYKLYLSDIYRYYSRDKEMLATLNTIEQMAPGEALIYPQRASYYLLIGDTVAYRNEYEKLITNDKIECRTKLDILSQSYLTEATTFDNDSSILRTFAQLVDYHPYETAPRQQYAMLLLYTLRYEEAAQQLTVIAEREENNKQLWEDILNIYIELNDSKKLIEVGEKALQAGSNKPVVYLVLSNAYLVEDQIEKSEALLRIALNKCRENLFDEPITPYHHSLIYGSLGDIYSSKEMLDECYQYYDSALTLYPENTMVLNNYAYKLATNDGDLLKAERMSNQTINAEPENVTFIDTYAWILFKKESYTLARIYMEKAIELLTEETMSAEIFDHYGDILAISGESEIAVEQWRKALELDPTLDKVKEKIEQHTNQKQE